MSTPEIDPTAETTDVSAPEQALQLLQMAFAIFPDVVSSLRKAFGPATEDPLANRIRGILPVDGASRRVAHQLESFQTEPDPFK